MLSDVSLCGRCVADLPPRHHPLASWLPLSSAERLPVGTWHGVKAHRNSFALFERSRAENDQRHHLLRPRVSLSTLAVASPKHLLSTSTNHYSECLCVCVHVCVCIDYIMCLSVIYPCLFWRIWAFVQLFCECLHAHVSASRILCVYVCVCVWHSRPVLNQSSQYKVRAFVLVVVQPECRLTGWILQPGTPLKIIPCVCVWSNCSL